jgi:hypothetical protein
MSDRHALGRHRNVAQPGHHRDQNRRQLMRRHHVRRVLAPIVVATFVVAGAAVPLAAATPEGAAPAGSHHKVRASASGTSALSTARAGASGAATTTAAAAARTKAKLGMSAPQASWAKRVKEVGPGLESRRVFVPSLSGALGVAPQACKDGMYPVISFGTGSYSWTQVANGAADAALRSLATKLAALPCDVFATIAHEPDGDGTAAQWSAMQAHALPLLGPDPGVKVGVIGNGWWWSSTSRGLSDAQLAAWIPRSVINVSDVIAGDTYQGKAGGEEPANKMANMAAWARRVGGVKGMGLGEFNAQSAASLTAITTKLGSDSLWQWGCLWNANGGGGANSTVLTGDRLTAFKKVLAAW